MAIIKQFDKRSGITYVYDSKSFYDKDKPILELEDENRQLKLQLSALKKELDRINKSR